MNNLNEYILKFVNSKDIREHLRSIGYTFNALEASWLIYQSRNTSLKTRHNAWKRVITEYPDCPIEKRMNTIAQPSLHRFLKEYIDMENRMLKYFCDPKGAVYQLEYHFHKDNVEAIRENRVFSSFDLKKQDLSFAEEDDIRFILCRRLPIDEITENALNKSFFVMLNLQMKITDISPASSIMEDRDKELLTDVFEGLWFDFPTPFQKGDILWDPDRPSGLFGGPFVCTSINLQGISDDKRINYMRKNADSSDMTAHGFFADGVEGIYGDCMHNYMNCEYYRKELTGSKLLLRPLSAYEKGEINAELLLHACRYIMLEVEKEYSGVKYYTEETLRKAGISL